MEIRPRRAETHPILAGVMMDEAILLPSPAGAARAARAARRAVCDAQIPSTVSCPMDGARAGVRIGYDLDQNAPDPACMVGTL